MKAWKKECYEGRLNTTLQNTIIGSAKEVITLFFLYVATSCSNSKDFNTIEALGSVMLKSPMSAVSRGAKSHGHRYGHGKEGLGLEQIRRSTMIVN